MRSERNTDTPLAVEDLLIEGYRKMSASEKLERVRQLNLAVQRLALADVRRRRPDVDSRELRLRLASRWLDAPLMRAAFGWDPDAQGY
jgi:hypothetical protein